MTLQERLKASAKELVRLLEEDERERERKAERVDRLANQPIKRFFKKLEDEGLISPVEMKLDNGKPFVRKEFKSCNHGGYSTSMIMLDAMREIQRLRARVATLEKYLETSQLRTDILPWCRNERRLCPAIGLENAPVCLSVVCACARKDGSPYPEAFEIVVKPGETLSYHLLKPNIGQEDRDKGPLTPESSSEDKTRTPGQEGT